MKPTSVVITGLACVANTEARAGETGTCGTVSLHVRWQSNTKAREAGEGRTERRNSSWTETWLVNSAQPQSSRLDVISEYFLIGVKGGQIWGSATFSKYDSEWNS